MSVYTGTKEYEITVYTKICRTVYIRIPIHVEAILEFGKTRFQYFSNLGQRHKKVDDEEVWSNNGKSLPYSIHGWRHYGKAFEKGDEEGAN